MKKITKKKSTNKMSINQEKITNKLINETKTNEIKKNEIKINKSKINELTSNKTKSNNEDYITGKKDIIFFDEIKRYLTKEDSIFEILNIKEKKLGTGFICEI